MLLIGLYCFYVYRTILKSRHTCVECECEKLYFKLANEKFSLFVQLFLSLIVLIFSSHFFVCEIQYFSNILNISPIVLSLLITPFATELPECVNSIIWLKQGKDDLAMANVVGAMIFQATIVFSLGILLTSWQFSRILTINFALTIAGALAFLVLMLKLKKITLAMLLFCGIIYFTYFVYIFAK